MHTVNGKSSVLTQLAEEGVLHVEKESEEVFQLYEGCDEHYGVLLSRDDLRRLAFELFQLSQS